MFDIDSFRDEVRDHLGVDEDDLPNTQLDLLINRSYQWLLDEFKFRVEEKSVTFPTIEGERNYDLPSNFESLRGISIEHLTTMQHTSLDRMTNDEYELKYVNDSDEENYPTHYVREGLCIRLWPTPDDIYTMTLKYNKLLTDLSDDNPTPEIPKAWHEWILMGAVYRGHYKYGDIPRARSVQAWIEGEIVKAKRRKETESREEEDSHRSGLEAYVPPYEL